MPEKLQFRVWDRISDKERRALGFALIRRKRLWDVCTTKNRTVGLQVIGRIGGTEIQATGELWVELRWEPRPFDPALNIDSSPDKWRPPTPEEVRPETPISEDESETSEMRAMRLLEEQLAARRHKRDFAQSLHEHPIGRTAEASDLPAPIVREITRFLNQLDIHQ